MKFDRLLWIRCANNLEHAFKATDMLLQAGGFGLVMLDLGDVPAKSAKRIISSWWYRFRRTLRIHADCPGGNRRGERSSILCARWRWS